MRHPNLAPLILLPLVVGCASAPDPEPGVLFAVAASSAPAIDGDGADAAWRDAPEIEVETEGGALPAVRMRAVVHGGVVHVLARWPDTTHDREHKVWTPKAGGGFAAGPEREDVFALGFPIAGEFTGDMLSPVECVWDVWQWKSARTNPAGYAMDKSHVNTLRDPGGKRYEHDFKDGRKLYIQRPEDAGTSSTKSLKAPASGAAQTPQYEAQRPAGSAADVRAKGAWRDGWWTVEFARSLRTGHADDADLDAQPSGVPFAIAILDRAEDEDHAASGVLRLRLVK